MKKAHPFVLFAGKTGRRMNIKIVGAMRTTFYVNVLSLVTAILQMEMLGHTFFMYRDGDTGEIDVVYKRRDGKYGVLEPEG